MLLQPFRIVKSALRVVDLANSAFAVAAGALLALASIAVLIQVVVRFAPALLGVVVSLPWTEELSRYALIWMIFIGAGVACRKGQMISLEFFANKLPRSLGLYLHMITTIICISFFVLLINVGLSFVELGRTEVSPAMQMQKSLLYWAMPIGCGLMAVNSVALVVERLIDRHDMSDVPRIEASE